VDGDGKPVAGARAHVYQTDATGQDTREGTRWHGRVTFVLR